MRHALVLAVLTVCITVVPTALAGTRSTTPRVVGGPALGSVRPLGAPGAPKIGGYDPATGFGLPAAMG